MKKKNPQTKALGNVTSEKNVLSLPQEQNIPLCKCTNYSEVNNIKQKILHLDQGNPKHKYRQGGEWIVSSPEEILEVLVGRKFNIAQQCVLKPKETNTSWAAIKAAWPAG